MIDNQNPALPDDEAQRLADISRIDELEQERINQPDELAAIKQASQALTIKQQNEGYSLDPKHGSAIHIYRSADGLILYARIRLKHADGNKHIRPMKRNERGAWVLGEPTHPETGKPLYNLDQLTARPDERLILTEGEYKADLLMMRGILATTSGGAASDEVTDWKPLAGRDVIIWADNDDAGSGYQDRVTAKLYALGCTVQHIDIAQLDLPPKGDVVDWLKAFADTHKRKATAEDIWALPQKTEPIERDLSDSNNAVDATPLLQTTQQHETSAQRTDEQTITWLASLTLIEYDRARKDHAQNLGIRPAVLDSLVKAERNKDDEADRLPFPEVEPCADPINPAQLLNEVSDTIKRFIVMDAEQADAAALWVAVTWFVGDLQIMPLAIINAPEKACGKTQLLTVMGRMVYRPLPASNASASALFRAVELWKPTILIDEADTFFKDNVELQGMVNAGYLRDGYVLRSEAVGDSFEPRMFSVYSPKAIAGIALEKHLAEATMSRGVVIGLRRKLPDESVDRLRYAEPDLFERIASKLARFAEEYSPQVRLTRPVLPDELGDRDQDNWEPLLAIASCAGDAWLSRANAAALKLSNAGGKTVSVANELLADIQTVFAEKRVDKISTADLIAALIEDDEAAWATYNRGRPLAPRQLSNQLKGYGITSKTIRINSYETVKGFEHEMFREAFERYLSISQNLPSHVTNSLKPSNGAAFNVTDRNSVTVTGFLSVTDKSSNGEGCDGVTDKTAILGVGEKNIIPASSVRI